MKVRSLDRRIMDSTSVALGGIIGENDDVERLQEACNNSSDPYRTACEIAVAFIRHNQDLKELNELRTMNRSRDITKPSTIPRELGS